MSPEQEARERAQLLKVLDTLIGWCSIELPEMHYDAPQRWCGAKPEVQIARDEA